MAHFAHLTNGVVDQVIVIDAETLALGHWGNPSEWQQTSYRTQGGQHPEGKPFKKNYAGIGMLYDGVGFYAPSPFPSWVKDDATYQWSAPTPMPVVEGKRFNWDEPTLSWVEITESDYQPKQEQAGKDVMWFPTSQELIDKMLTIAEVKENDLVYDLGAGDGIIAIAAAKQYGARAIGIEYNPDMAEFARRKVAEAGVQDKVHIITGDIFKEDFSEATVVTMYLLSDLNLKLRPTILKMKPGTRVVSHAFDMGDWEPDQKIYVGTAAVFLWTVPANIQGV